MSSLALTVEELRAIEPRFTVLEEAPVRSRDGSVTLGWHSSAIGNLSGIALGSGTAETREEARRIAIAEALERSVIRKLRESEDRSSFGLDCFPTSCGFAAGFESESTRMRSICEAVERWARALWIDERYVLSPIAIGSVLLSRISSHFLAYFQESLLFRQNFTVQDPVRKNFLGLQIGVVLGLTETDVFPGSRVCSDKESPWEHACLEAWRHYEIVRMKELSEIPEKSYLHRISYFSTHRDEALREIERVHRYDWPRPEIMIHRSYEAIPKKLHIWRSLCRDYQGWNRGPISRFVF